MEKPFDLEVVDALIARALRQTQGIDHSEPSDLPFSSEWLATRILVTSTDVPLDAYDGSAYASAGFRLALRLCCRILADPLRVHRGSVRRDINSVLIWLNRSRKESR
jgi:hypothetical protein